MVGESASPGQAEIDAVWNYVADSQIGEARVVLEQVNGADPRTLALARAVVAMSRPPLSMNELPAVDAALADLARGDDETSALALYLRARLFQVHSSPPDYPRAMACYRELSRRHPRSHWAQLGLVKLGLVQLYALAGPADASARLAAVAALLGSIEEPALKRDLQLQIGWAGLFYKRPLDEVLPHLIAADRAGGLLGITPEELVIQIGELSLRAGHLLQARAYFERFLHEYPTNIRRYNVRQRLAEIAEKLAPGARESS